MASKSVGMFQRPVEYRVNCLELVYEFSGLNLRHLNPYRDGPKYLEQYHDYQMTYNGKCVLQLCALNFLDNVVTAPEYIDEIENPVIRVRANFDINTIHKIDLYSASSYEQAIDKNFIIQFIETARTVSIQNLQVKNIFYELVSDFIKQKLIDKGYDPIKVRSSLIEYEVILSEIYLYAGSYYKPSTYDYFVAVASDVNGRTLFDTVWGINSIKIKPGSHPYNTDYTDFMEINAGNPCYYDLMYFGNDELEIINAFYDQWLMDLQ